MKKLFFLLLFFCLSTTAHARSTYNKTIGIIGMGNIQVLNTIPDIDPGPGGGLYFDYRFNQRFSITVDAWATTHDGNGPSNGDDSIQLLGIPTATIKLYFMDDESSKWDPYAGIGVGVYATTEGDIPNGSNGVGLGAQIDLGVDYYFTNVVSLGFSGVFRTAGIITSLSSSGNNSIAMIPYSLMLKMGFHF